MKYVYTNDLKELEKIAADIESFAEAEAISPAVAHAFNLCLDEIFTNIVSYAFGDDGQHEVLIELRREGEDVVAVVSDAGQSFNPLTDSKEPDLESDIEDRDIGGLGIFFVKELMDAVDYQRDGDRNVLTLRKRNAPDA